MRKLNPIFLVVSATTTFYFFTPFTMVAAEVVSEKQVSQKVSFTATNSPPSDTSQSSCEDDFKKNECANFAQDPELKDQLIDCQQPQGEFQFLKNSTLGCLVGIVNLSVDSTKGLQELPQSLMSSASSHLKEKSEPSVKFYQFKQKCLKDLECKVNLYKAAYSAPPQKADIERLKGLESSWFGMRDIDLMWNRAFLRGGLKRDGWYKTTSDNLFKVNSTQQDQLFAKAMSLLDQKYSRYKCLNANKKAEKICYAAALVTGGLTAGARMAAKFPVVAAQMQKLKSLPVIGTIDYNRTIAKGEAIAERPNLPSISRTRSG